MERRSERLLGSRTRPMKSNKDDHILIDDTKVCVIVYVVNLWNYTIYGINDSLRYNLYIFRRMKRDMRRNQATTTTTVSIPKRWELWINRTKWNTNFGVRGKERCQTRCSFRNTRDKNVYAWPRSMFICEYILNLR